MDTRDCSNSVIPTDDTTTLNRFEYAMGVVCGKNYLVDIDGGRVSKEDMTGAKDANWYQRLLQKVDKPEELKASSWH